MPIRNCPIYSFPDNKDTLILPIKIINPHNSKFLKTWGLIDTGASECALPSRIADILGHDLIMGKMKEINTGNGLAKAYCHTSTIEIYHPQHLNDPSIFRMENVLIDFMPNLNVPLLGVKGFLSNFILKIDFPNRIFLLTK
jgi:predicted aspartyl protease